MHLPSVQMQFTNNSDFQKTTLNDSKSDSNQNFQGLLKNSLEKVNELQNISENKTRMAAFKEIDQLHDVMITAEKASIALETTVQIQQKVIDAYNEVMRMQI